VMNAHKGVVRYLADHQADKEAKDEKGQTLFRRVVKDATKVAMEVLIYLNMEKEVVNNERQTPLHIAAAIGKDEIVDLLLRKGALKTAVAAQNRTPLSLALVTTKLDLQRLCIQRAQAQTLCLPSLKQLLRIGLLNL